MLEEDFVMEEWQKQRMYRELMEKNLISREQAEKMLAEITELMDASDELTAEEDERLELRERLRRAQESL